MSVSFDLPHRKGDIVVFDITGRDDDHQYTVKIEKRGKLFYGDAGEFDFEGTAEEVCKKLFRWNAKLVGWETVK